jgi:hypothetical protein
MARLRKTMLVAFVALAMFGTGFASPAAADVDQCAPPGVQSASALPTNLAAAAKGPGEDKYTTPTVAPLAAVDVAALRLSTPGVLTVGTLSDAPPSICINSQGQFTGFDNELLRAIADKLGLQVNFVGTEFSGLLAQTASGRFDVGSSSITTTDARRRTVGFTNGYDFGYFSLVVPTGSPITGFEKLAAGQRIGVVQQHLLDAGNSPNTAAAYGYDLPYLFEFFAEIGLDWREFRPAIAFDLLGWPLGASAGGTAQYAMVVMPTPPVAGSGGRRCGRRSPGPQAWTPQSGGLVVDLTNQIPETISARLL